MPEPTSTRTRTQALAICAAAALLGVIAAGCGASKPAASSKSASGRIAAGAPSGSATGSPADTHRVAAIKYARCMRSHGVNVLDPDQNGNIQIAAPNTPKPVINRAQKACQALRSASLGPGMNAQQHAQALAQFTRFTRCMRAHQIPMADPITGPQGAVGYYVPQGISPSSQLYKNAEAACKHLLPNG
jgi:hypothetical protein